MIDIHDAELDARPTDQELYSKPKEEPICPHCKSIDVVVDSTSSWCPEVQKFDHVNSFDMWWCQNTECNRDEFKYADWRPL
tara:strand:+ start:387 stop:629 length:243 start_codon:yes stop_codon:yes gene_type:complete